MICLLALRLVAVREETDTDSRAQCVSGSRAMVWTCAKQVGSLVVRRHLGLRTWQSSSAQARLCWWRVAAGVGVSGTRNMSTTEHIVFSHVPDIPLPTGNVASHILEMAMRWSTNTAVECGVTGRKYTYAQMVDAIARWSGYLSTLGLRRGDKLAIMMLNCPEYVVVMIGTVAVDIHVTFINFSYTPEEVCQQLRDSDASLVVHDDVTGKVVEAALSLLQKPLRRVTNTDGSPPAGVPNLKSLLQDSSLPLVDPVEIDGTETAMLPYSSGTTGKPKGVSLSHNAFCSNVAIYTHPEFFSGKMATGSHQDSFLCYLPLFHVYGILPITMVGLRYGAKLVMLPKFDSKTFISQIVKHKVSVLHTVPPVLNFMTQSQDVNSESMASVTSVLCGAAPVSYSSAKIIQEKSNKSLFFQEGYGMSEVLISHATPLNSTHVGSCLLPNVKCKIIDTETGKSLPANKKGEICFKTPSMMTNYLNNEAATQETIDEEGWLHSGDIGYYDDDNYFHIVDRIKELIKVKALQVAPSELEEVILQHPKVKEVGVTGVPHDKLGEAPLAFVVTSSPVTEKEIQEYLASHVAPHKQLAGGVVFISELPKTGSGKVLRKKLRELAQGSSL